MPGKQLLPRCGTPCLAGLACLANTALLLREGILVSGESSCLSGWPWHPCGVHSYGRTGRGGGTAPGWSLCLRIGGSAGPKRQVGLRSFPRSSEAAPAVREFSRMCSLCAGSVCPRGNYTHSRSVRTAARICNSARTLWCCPSPGSISIGNIFHMLPL